MPSLALPVTIPASASIDLKVLYHEGIDVDDGTVDGVQTVEVRLPTADVNIGQAISCHAYCTDGSGNIDPSITWAAQPIVENEEDAQSSDLGGNTIIGFKFHLTVPPSGYTWHPGIFFLAGPVWSTSPTT